MKKTPVKKGSKLGAVKPLKVGAVSKQVIPLRRPHVG
jgi:hypothetical protein